MCLLRASSELTPEIQTINTASVPELNHSTHKLHRKRGWKHNDALAWVNLPFAKHLAKYFESGGSVPLPYNVLPWIKMSPNSKFPGNHTNFEPHLGGEGVFAKGGKFLGKFGSRMWCDEEQRGKGTGQQEWKGFLRSYVLSFLGKPGLNRTRLAMRFWENRSFQELPSSWRHRSRKRGQSMSQFSFQD